MTNVCNKSITDQRIYGRSRLATLAIVLAVLLSTIAGVPHAAFGQDSSLFQKQETATEQQQSLSLEESSWYYRKLPPPKQVKVHDLISIRVDENSLMGADGEVERRKSAKFDAILSDWVHLEGLRKLMPDKQADGDPKVGGKLNSTYRSESEVKTTESLKFRIMAQVADIRPNGNLVIEAHKVVRNNEETWEYSLSGICRAEDVVGNTVMSENLAELNIFKRERGHVRDGYQRGWLLRWWDTLHAF